MIGPYKDCARWILRIRLPWYSEKGIQLQPDIWPARLPQTMTAAAWKQYLYFEWNELVEMTEKFPFRFELISKQPR